MAAAYILLPQRRWDSEFRGPWFQIGARRNWTFTLRISSFPVSGSVTVDVEVSPVGLESDWRTLVSFGAQTSRIEIKKNGGTAGEDFTFDAYQEVYMRAHIKSDISGICIAECRASASFFDTSDPDQQGLLSQEVREWSEGMARIVEQSEEEVMLDLIYNPNDGRLKVDLERPGATEAIRREIALQADYNRRRSVLERSSDPSALVSIREMSRGAPGRSGRLRPYFYLQGNPWLGR